MVLPLAVTAYGKLQDLPSDGIAFRVLNALLEHAPTQEGAAVIATDILAAAQEPNGLEQLAQFYVTGLLLPMKAGGRTPQVSYHPSREEEIKSDANAIASELETAKRDQTKLKKYTLLRDSYRCVVTRAWDLTSVQSGKCQPLAGEPEGPTQAAHILPFSLMSVDNNKMLFKKCTIWSVIRSFTNIEFRELSGDNINSLTNVLTLEQTVHTMFGTLAIWFEAIPDRLNTYRLRKARPNILAYMNIADGTEVTLTSPDAANLPIPDPRYLAFHAAVARVVHMAGMAEHLDDLLRERDHIRVLSDDPSADYLDGLLRIAQQCIVTH